MRKVYDTYMESQFRSFHELSKKEYENALKMYDTNYRKFLPSDKNIKILDIGCGTGQFLYYLKEKGYKNYYGIDISKQQVEFCKKITKNVEQVGVFEFYMINKKHIN